jgi:hypothetical protein
MIECEQSSTGGGGMAAGGRMSSGPLRRGDPLVVAAAIEPPLLQPAQPSRSPLAPSTTLTAHALTCSVVFDSEGMRRKNKQPASVSLGSFSVQRRSGLCFFSFLFMSLLLSMRCQSTALTLRCSAYILPRSSLVELAHCAPPRCSLLTRAGGCGWEWHLNGRIIRLMLTHAHI